MSEIADNKIKDQSSLIIDQILEGENARNGLESVARLPNLSPSAKDATEKYLAYNQFDLGMEICIICSAIDAAKRLGVDNNLIGVSNFFLECFPVHGSHAIDPRTGENYPSGFEVFRNKDGRPFITHPAVLFYLRKFGVYGDTIGGVTDIERMRTYSTKGSYQKKFIVSLDNRFIIDNSINPSSITVHGNDTYLLIDINGKNVERRLNPGTHMVEVDFLEDGIVKIYDPFRYPPVRSPLYHEKVMDQKDLEKYLTGRWMILSDNEQILTDDELEFPDDPGMKFGRSFPLDAQP